MSKKNYFDLYLLIAVLYALKSILYPRGTILSLGITGLFVASTFVLTAAAVFNTKMPKVLKSYLAFIVVLSFYGLILYLSHETIIVKASGSKTGGSQFLEAILFSNLPIFSSYYLSKKDYYSESHFKIWVFVLFALSIVRFYYHQDIVLSSKIGGEFEDEMTNNEAYLFVALIPMLCLFEKQRIIQYVGMGVCFLFLLMGMKRGAILTGTVEIMAFLYLTFRQGTRKTKNRVVFITALLFVLVYYIFQRMLFTSEYFAYKYNMTLEGYTSSRDVILEQIMNYFRTDMTTLDMLFGRGALATVKMFVNYAHNDWLELMVNHGLLGVSLFFIFFIYLLIACRKAKDLQIKKSLTLIFIAFFLPTLFSMSYSCLSFSLACYFGYSVSKI